MAIRPLALMVAAGAMLAACSGQPTTTTDAAATPTTTESAPTTSATDSLASAATTTGSAYTLDDVAKHATQDDCWTAIDGVVYDLTKFVSAHPGGDDKIIGLCGRDGTDDFNGEHGSDDRAKLKLANFEIGVISN